MKKVTEFSQSDTLIDHLKENKISLHVDEERALRQIRPCPACNHLTIKGMAGGRDAVCKICGYKDPCCSD